MSRRGDDPPVTVKLANLVAWEDLAEVLGSRAAAARCWCQRYKLAPGESFGSFPAGERADRLRQQARCGDEDAERTSGLLAYLGEQPVGWCAVEPRPAYGGLVRNARVPWEGRDQDRDDEDVWAVTCLLTRARFGRRGISTALARAAVAHARASGATALEAYPITMTGVVSEELHVGTVGVFAEAGMRVVAEPSARRVVMRIDF
jgi:GNAT superfamily N-acetyltransferase